MTVHSEIGSMSGILERPFPQIKAGNALMYYPEANQLLSRRTDKLSRTPAFKGGVVTLDKSQDIPD